MQTWKEVIGQLKQTDFFKQAYAYQKQQRMLGKNVFPPEDQIFNAFVYTPFEKLKVVIIGQDPYHEKGQAMGLSFSVPVGIPVPRSLCNIYKELTDDIPGFKIPNHGNLVPWARQGVLLLNTVLTVNESEANSHKGQGWEKFTDGVIKAISTNCSNIVFLLWGNNAAPKASLIDDSKHLVLISAHPSPLSASRGFFGNHHFSKTNEYLIAHGKRPINWQLPEFLDGTEEL